MSDPEDMVVTLTVRQLRELMRESVREALAQQKLEARPLEPMLSPRQAAEILNVSARQVQVLCASGELQARKFGGQWRIHRADLASKVRDHDAA